MPDTLPVRTKPTLLSQPPQRLHHHAYAVKDQEVNRQFMEDILGIPLIATWCERNFNKAVGRDVDVLPHLLRHRRRRRVGVLPIRRRRGLGEEQGDPS